MRRGIDNLFNTSYQTGKTGYPPVNVYDTGNEVLVRAELPGMVKADIGVTFAEGNLTLSGKRKPLVENGTYAVIRNERVSGEFEKNFSIPYSIVQDKISADFKNGVLTITLPKAEEAKPRKIDVCVN